MVGRWQASDLGDANRRRFSIWLLVFTLDADSDISLVAEKTVHWLIMRRDFYGMQNFTSGVAGQVAISRCRSTGQICYRTEYPLT